MSTRTSPRPWSATRAVAVATFAIMMALGLRSPASAQAYPVKPIHIIVPFAAGGITDVIGRALGQRLARGLGSTGRDREQAGRRHRSGRHRIRRAIRTRRLHASGDRRRDLRHLASYLQQAAVRPHQRLRTGHRSRHQPAGAGRASLAAGAHARQSWSITPGRDRASSIMEPSALDRADISTSFCWKA